ncbi:VOC family protein [Streptomyces orinoci]|uniref:VOC family protein n=1 Tax=Streptomyces orinoci TaxID=67339 RepID=A0ABV3JYL4_STRON|nr:VOC family protein [Streptomyces orinoci]
MSTRLAGVVIQAVDVPALAGFWAQALRWPVAEERGVTILRSGEADGPALLLVPADRPKAGKNRVHLDLAGGPAEVRRLLGLGAVRVDIGQRGVPWEVLADPEGNELCVLPRAEEDGRPVQICQDAADPAAQGAFWAAAAGWHIVAEGAWGVRLRAPSGCGPELVMGPPVAAKAEPSRLYPLLECPPGAGPHRLLELGAMRPDAGRTGGVPWETFTDPEGNEFGLLG